MIRRLFVLKKKDCRVSAKKLSNEFKQILGIKVEDVLEFNRYDIEGIEDKDYELAKTTIFSELPIDIIYEEQLPELEHYKIIVIEYLPGQYDQRADSASQCVQLLTMKDRLEIRCARVIAIKGVDDIELKAIKDYLINPVESREGSMDKPHSLKQEISIPSDVKILNDFVNYNDKEIADFHKEFGFAMSVEDLIYVRDYFISDNRPPSITELKVIDTYWSDHCRHTTFLTEITDIKVTSDNPHILKSLELYDNLFKELYCTRQDKYKCLMDIATIAGKKLVKEGILDNLDISDEINACSIVVDIDHNDKMEKWLIMFKNETHNHPTEIEPFGGAATCLGGAIRDPLSGRSYVYQAMRVTGSGDPRATLKETIKGKLPQRVITTTATAGFSSYGNQIGLATGIVDEMYHKGYIAKRLETGYVIGAAPYENVVRRKPIAGDVVVLLGGDTGRDGCGGATGSSKAHTVDSVDECGAEVQKGNPLTERKIQRLFRNSEASKLIVKCNDFGAGGVSVAIGELADGIDIDLDSVPKKYAGLDGTELAISESQERMAVMLPKERVDEFIQLADKENLKCTPVAIVTNLNRIRMKWRDTYIVDINRNFLDTNGVKQLTKAHIIDNKSQYISNPQEKTRKLLANNKIKEAILYELTRLNVASKKGMSEIFDSTIGAGSVYMPWGGKHQLTPVQVMAAKVPVRGYTDTATFSSYGCYPDLNVSSPFTGAITSIMSSVSKLVSAGVDYKTIRLTLQEFFKKLGQDSERWGEPLSAILGALYAQINLGLGAIGGKDSMSGTFEDIDVPPTLISFAVGISKASKCIVNVFNNKGDIFLAPLRRDDNNIPDFEYAKELWSTLYSNKDKIIASQVVEEGGSIIACIKSALGNKIGIEFDKISEDMFSPKIGDFVLQLKEPIEGIDLYRLASVNDSGNISCKGKIIDYKDIVASFTSTLENIYPTTVEQKGEAIEKLFIAKNIYKGNTISAKPKVLIPVFPGTNCEYDTAKRFEVAGAEASIYVIRNKSSEEIVQSVQDLANLINNSQIVAFPGGFSGGDEPDGSGKFIATTFRNPQIQDAMMRLLEQRDGLAIGICNGFQALIKLGLVPYGKIHSQECDSPTLTYNTISRHVSAMARVKIVSNNSPWLNNIKVGDTYAVPISHGEGRFIASFDEIKALQNNGQIFTQYVDLDNNVTMQSPYNPNGSMNAIEGIMSYNGRVLGKMGHCERIGENLYKNIDDKFDMKIFESGVGYYK